MFKTNRFKLQMFGVSMWIVVVIGVIGVVTTQQASPYQYTPPQINDFNYDRRYSSYRGSASQSPSPRNSDVIRFPEMSPANVYDGSSDGNQFSERRNKNNRDVDESSSNNNDNFERSNEVSYVPMNVTNELNTYEDFFSFLDEESRGQIAVISPRFGGGAVERSAASRPTPANCVPEMRVVPLNLADESDIKDPTIVVFPSCTRVKRCGGCCTNNLVSCQPMETHNIVYEVFKSQYQHGGKLKFLNKELVEVEEHLRCKCDCRKKATDCNQFQRYDKAQCQCKCINTEDRNKCLAETSEKMWDPDTCTCRCRETKDCTTGTYFDPNTCSCQETPGHRHTQEVTNRRRLIIKPVTYIPETPQTFYDSGT